jgi:hypothetical protein
VRTAIVVSALVLAGSLGCRMLDSTPQSSTTATLLPGQSNAVFTTARPTVGVAVAEFFDWRPEPEQPLQFPHNIHADPKKEISCTDYCHEAVSTGPRAGLPSVRTCLVCHNTIATDKPRIRELTAMHARGEDFVWQRVYGYAPQAHVRFNHAPHIRADVQCSTCHGPIHEGTVARRNVDLTMGFCVNCHNERKASIDCLTCHF